MKKWLLVIFLLVPGTVYGNTFCRDVIEINLIKKEIKVSNLYLGNYKVNGEFSFGVNPDKGLPSSGGVNEKNGSLTLDIRGRKISFASLTGEKNKVIPWVEGRLNLRQGIIFIPYLYLPQLAVNGKVDLEKNELSLDLEGGWREKSKLLEGEMKVKVKAWGGVGSFLVSGYLVVEGGKYKGKDFSHLRLDFLGRPPVLNITDSQLVLKDGNVVEIKGVLDLRDFSNILPGAEYEVQKAYIGQWQLFSGEDKNVGLKKQLDGKIDVFVNTSPEVETWGPQTEVRYNWKDDKYLKLKMEGEGTTLRLEKRRDF